MKYVGTFGSGWTNQIVKIFTKKFLNIKILNVNDGLIIFETSENLDVNRLYFFNNVYLLLDMYKYSNYDFNNNISEMIKKINLNYSEIKLNLSGKKYNNFKIIGILKNQPCSIDYNNILKLEKNISKGLKINVGQRKHDLDFIFLQRNEDYIYFLLKLTYNRKTEKDLKKGTLRPELSYLLADYADIKEDDIVLDPFCGSGAIPKEIVKHFKYNMCFASDIDEAKIQLLKNEYKKNNKKLFIKNLDALDLNKFDDNFIDVIVTDPPWNIYEKSNTDFKQFYLKMLSEMSRVLKKNGRAIILMGNIVDFEYALNNNSNFIQSDSLSILVNGKKAKVYSLIKRKNDEKSNKKN